MPKLKYNFLKHMNYSESVGIKQKIDTSQKILLNMHHNPDADSVGSALSMARVLKKWAKEVRILTPTPIPANLQFLLKDDKVEIVDFSQIDFTAYDFFISNDSSSWPRICGSHDIPFPEIPFAVIDHHATNQKFGTINLIVPDAAANCQVLYSVFEDWGVDIEPELAEPLLAGIIGDTGALRFPEADINTFEIVTELVSLTDKNKIMFNLYQSFGQNHIMVWKEIMNNLQIDAEHKFVYSFIKKEVLGKNGKPFNAKSELADMVFQSIEGTSFGLVGAEDEGYISVSFRAREPVDVSKLAQSLGGGGHAWAAAARVAYNNDIDYDKAVEKILQSAREFSEKLKS